MSAEIRETPFRQDMAASLRERMANRYSRNKFQDSEKCESLTVNGYDSRIASVFDIALKIEYSFFQESK
jgi:hypothetical protein